MDCVFCKIRDGQIPSFKIHEDDARSRSWTSTP